MLREFQEEIKRLKAMLEVGWLHVISLSSLTSQKVPAC
jgi:hypothetical protein